MTTVLNAVREQAAAPGGAVTEVRVALLGLGNVGGAIAELIRHADHIRNRLPIVSALVRDVHRPRAIDTSAIPLTADPLQPLASRPDVVVEVLGGLEPARTIVIAALASGIPVVTANKSLLAAHGDELFEAAAASGAPLLYEASVLAGVPFLGTFRRRPLARDISGITGIVNGTSNFILSRMAADRVSFADALADAQQAGYAEPDPAKDVGGDDAIEKLCVLLRHFGGWSISPAEIEKSGIEKVQLQDLQQAAAFGGVIRPVATADWDADSVRAYAGPAFVAASHSLARVNGVQNAVSLRSRWSPHNLFFSGPGAGPTVTAATVLDDVVEAHEISRAPSFDPVRETRLAVRPPAGCGAPESGWFIRIDGAALSDAHTAPSLLAGLGVRMHRTSPLAIEGNGRQWLLTSPCLQEHITAALDVLVARVGGAAWSIRVIE